MNERDRRIEEGRGKKEEGRRKKEEGREKLPVAYCLEGGRKKEERSCLLPRRKMDEVQKEATLKKSGFKQV
ncbi:MAG: hypothetical protein HC849_09970 [Oscillatoriales cyanobacterium RU_3_3]|nr:hypothetical protein [Oscillatoriales cyanobacterium RU_3_3]